MTAFARKVLGGLPAPNVAGAANNYSIAQDFTNDTDKAGGKVDLQVSPTLSLFGRYGWRSLSTNDQPPIPLPSGGGGNGNIYTRNKQLVLGTTYIAERSIAARGALRLVEHAGRQEPAGARHDATASASPACRPIRASPAACRRRRSPATPAFGRQATNPQWQYPDGVEPEGELLVADGPPVAQGRLRIPAHQRRGAGRQPAVRPRQLHRPVHAAGRRARANNLYNLADFMLGLRSQYALSTFLVANMQQDLHFTYVQDDIRVNDKLTLNAGLRYEYATPMWEANNLLTNFDPVTQDDDHGQGRIDLPTARWSIPIATTSARASASPTRRCRRPSSAAAGASATCTSTASDRRTCSAINGPQVVRAAVNQTPTDRRLRADRSGLSGRPHRPVEVQPADRAGQLHPARLPLEPGAELARLGAARVRPAHADRRRLRRQQGDRPAARGELQPGGAEQRRRARFRWRRAGRFRPGATSPTSSTAASRATTRSR